MSTDARHYAGEPDVRQEAERGGGGMRKPTDLAVARVDALDALRGYAILTMALSGLVPWGTLPQWMYHAQLIAPQMNHDLSVAGLTWVDLVFPFFLFALGASIPLAMARHVESGTSHRMVAAGLLRRFALLAFFAIYAQHISPHVISMPPGTRAWVFALLGYALLFPVLMRLPACWTRRRILAVRLAGGSAVITLLASLNWQSGDSASTLLGRIVHTSDIIIVVLANMALFGGATWWLTRGRTLMRIGVMLLLVAFRMAHAHADWIDWLWSSSPLPWIFRAEYLQYLLIVLPGTLVGDRLTAGIRPAESDDAGARGAAAQRGAVVACAAACLAIIVLTLAGLQARHVAETAVACATLGVIGGGLLLRHPGKHDRLLAELFGVGIMWLLLGLLCEPFEGGIRKDRATLSYYFVTAGLACLALLFFHVLMGRLNARRALGWLIATGQNPLLAYAGIRSLLAPLVMLTGLERVLVDALPTPWLGVLRAAIKTGMLAAVVAFCTRRRVCWRA